MGASRDDFVKYPRTPHLFGSRGTDDDKHLSPDDTVDFIADSSLIVEEKLDGTNVGIHFTTTGRMVLQCRGHEISAGMHAQYDLFKQWTMGKRPPGDHAGRSLHPFWRMAVCEALRPLSSPAALLLRV